MAKSLKPGEAQEGGNLTNVAARGDSINKAFAELAALDGEIGEANAKHVQPLKDSRKRVWRELKADTDINLKVLKPIYALKKVELDAEALEEEDDTTEDDLREAFQALVDGQTVNWINALGINEEK